MKILLSAVPGLPRDLLINPEDLGQARDSARPFR